MTVLCGKVFWALALPVALAMPFAAPVAPIYFYLCFSNGSWLLGGILFGKLWVFGKACSQSGGDFDCVLRFVLCVSYVSRFFKPCVLSRTYCFRLSLIGQYEMDTWRFYLFLRALYLLLAIW